MKYFISLIVLCIGPIDAFEMPLNDAQTITIQAGKDEFKLPKEVVLQSKTINDAYAMNCHDPIKLPAELRPGIPVDWTMIFTVMKECYKHKNRSGSSLLDI